MLVECPSALKAEQRMAGVETLLWVLTQLGRLIDFYQLIGSEHTHTQNSIFFTLHITRSETAANPERYLNHCYLGNPQQGQFVDFTRHARSFMSKNQEHSINERTYASDLRRL